MDNRTETTTPVAPSDRNTRKSNRNRSRRQFSRNRTDKDKRNYSRRGSEKNKIPTVRSTSNLRVCTLSGTTEVGRNCNFIEYKDTILVIDAGFSFPGQELYGIDYLIPNIQYLKENKSKIKAILITHGHLDHTGALQYILEDLGNPPIYAGAFANALIKEKLSETKLKGKAKFVDVFRNTKLEFGPFKVQFIGVTHSIPNAFSIFVESSAGNVFFSGDYKIDQNPENEPHTDYSALRSLKGKVDIALMESTNPEAEGKAKSAKEVAVNIENIIKQQKGRVVVAMFSSLLSRLYSVIKIAERTNRKVFVSGRSLNTALKIAREQRYITYLDELIVNEKFINDYPDDQVLLLTTGSQGERFSALNRISLGEHKYFKAKQGDMIMLSASEIPTNVTQIERMTDRLITQGVELIQNGAESIHESGHALKMDMHMMFEMVEPKEVIPIHGSMTMRYKNRKNYVAWGMDPNKVHLTTDGQTWERVGNRWQKGPLIEAKPILIDGLGVGDTGEVVLKDREQLAEYGMVTVILNLSSRGHKLLGRPKFVSRGFVYVKTSKEMFKEMENIVIDTHKKWLSTGDRKHWHETDDFLRQIESDLSKYIYKKTEREPMILPVIV